MAPDTDTKFKVPFYRHLWVKIWFVQTLIMLVIGPSVLIINEYKHTVADGPLAFRATMGEVLGLALILAALMTGYLYYLVSRRINRLTAQIMSADKNTLGGPDIPPPDHHDEIGALQLHLRDYLAHLHDRLQGGERFAADVAHELKNPLTSLRSALETLPLMNDQEKRQRLYDLMIEDTHRLNRLITDIAQLSRLDSQLAQEDVIALDLRMPLRQALRGYVKGDVLMGPHLPTHLISLTRNVQINLQIPDALPRVRGHVLRLQQVLDNLIDNAISFSPNGDTMTIQATANNGTVFLFIDDRGPGIPDGKETAIFDRFYSQRPDGETYGHHSGLGLSIAQHIVTALGGQIYAENRRGPEGQILGARFVVELPVA